MIDGSAPLLAGLELVAELGSPVLKHDGAIRGVCVTPDGRRIISIGGGRVRARWLDRVRRRSRAPAIRRQRHRARAASTQQGITVLALATERCVLPSDLGHVRSVEDLAIASARPHVLFSIGADSSIVMWDLEGGTTLDADHAIVLRVSDGFDSSVIEVWSVSKRVIVASADLTPVGERASSIAASPDGRRIYVGTTTSRILVFERGN